MVTKAEAAQELIFRRKARTNLLSFIQYINPDYIVSDFVIDVCAALDTFLVDMMNGLRPVLILSAPPQHGKSDMVSRYLPAYTFGRHKELRIAGLSYAKDLASDMNRDVQRIMMSDEYKRLFPDACLNSRRVVNMEVEAKRNSETFEIVGHRGSYVGQGVGGPLTGKKVDLGIIDDPIKNAQEALSETTKRSVWNWYTSTFITRLSKNSGQIIMATRWAIDDLSGRIIENNTRAKVLTFPAINEQGEALVPGLHPIDKLLETKATLSDFFWSAMYQQNPIPIGGNIFKDEWWQYWRALPKIQYRMIYVDTAQKTKEQNDYTVFECWGKGVDGRIYLLDMIRDKWEAPQLLVQARAFWQKHRSKTEKSLGTLRKMKIEDKVSGTGLIQQLSQGKNRIPVEGIPRDKDKTIRALDVAPQIEIGNVVLPESHAHLSDLLTEAKLFPNGAHDDTLDPMMDAIEDMLLDGRFSDYRKII